MSVLRVSDLSVRFGPRTVLDGVSLAVEAGELLGLIGPNGAGKTTLLRAACNLLSPDAGSVFLDGRDVRAIGRLQLARRLAYLPQDPTIHWPLSVGRLVALGRLPHLGPWQRPRDVDAGAVAEAVRAADLIGLEDRIVTTLSGGERVRAMLARALAVEPEVLLADEPVASLDPYHQLQTMELLRRLSDAGRAAIVVLHDLTLAARFCHRLVLLDAGRLAAAGNPAEVLRPETLAAVYGVEARFAGADRELSVVPWRRLPSAPGPEPGP